MRCFSLKHSQHFGDNIKNKHCRDFDHYEIQLLHLSLSRGNMKQDIYTQKIKRYFITAATLTQIHQMAATQKLLIAVNCSR